MNTGLLRCHAGIRASSQAIIEGQGTQRTVGALWLGSAVVNRGSCHVRGRCGQLGVVSKSSVGLPIGSALPSTAGLPSSMSLCPLVFLARPTLCSPHREVSKPRTCWVSSRGPTCSERFESLPSTSAARHAARLRKPSVMCCGSMSILRLTCQTPTQRLRTVAILATIHFFRCHPINTLPADCSVDAK